MKGSICHFTKWQIDPFISNMCEMNGHLSLIFTQAKRSQVTPPPPRRMERRIRWHCLQTKDSNFEPLSGLRPSTLSLGHRGSTQYQTIWSEGGKKHLFLWNINARAGDESMSSDFPGGSFNHYIRTLTKSNINSGSIMSILLCNLKMQ